MNIIFYIQDLNNKNIHLYFLILFVTKQNDTIYIYNYELRNQ